MAKLAKISGRIAELVFQHNRRLATDALLKAALGSIFTLVVFGCMYCGAWFFAYIGARRLGLQPWVFGLIVTGIFLALATWSAWNRVDPLAGVQPLSDREQMHMLVSEAVGLGYFSPRHASVGIAVILLGGPASVIESIGIWKARLRVDSALIDDAARLLQECDGAYPAKMVSNLLAGILLRRLALIKIISDTEAQALTLTDKGYALLAGKKGK